MCLAQVCFSVSLSADMFFLLVCSGSLSKCARQPQPYEGHLALRKEVRNVSAEKNLLPSRWPTQFSRMRDMAKVCLRAQVQRNKQW